LAKAKKIRREGVGGGKGNRVVGAEVIKICLFVCVPARKKKERILGREKEWRPTYGEEGQTRGGLVTQRWENGSERRVFQEKTSESMERRGGCRDAQSDILLRD